jgi:hypothetical protein
MNLFSEFGASLPGTGHFVRYTFCAFLHSSFSHILITSLCYILLRAAFNSLLTPFVTAISLRSIAVLRSLIAVSSVLSFRYILFIFYLLNLAHLFLPVGPVLCETHVLSPFAFFGLSVILYCLFQNSLFPELSASLSCACSLVPYTLSSLCHL